MRFRAAAVATTAALALSALCVPASGAAAAAGTGPVAFSAVSTNKRWMPVKPVTPNTVKVSYTIRHAADVPLSDIHADVLLAKAEFYGGKTIAPRQAPLCVAADRTSALCEVVITVDPRTDLKNVDSQSPWELTGRAWRKSRPAEVFTTPLSGNVYTPRAAYLPMDAGPEPVVKGQILTVKGTVQRANWETGDYRSYNGAVGMGLWFRKKGGTVQSHVTGVETDGKGTFTKRLLASEDGYWQWKIQGNATTNRTVSREDYVDVR
ncbi:hypothetical protein [Streptomyces sp. NPDC086023]|uniref:hypothetical protein n=1 Tax=Streptomyces sp. NPDC086023 TaxID=3365746 RepID=UPI0037D598DB